jgi:PAS domain S-box-containing protein
MMYTEQLAQTLLLQSDGLGQRWLHALNKIGGLSTDMPDLPAALGGMTEQLLKLLGAEHFDQEAAEALGADIARLLSSDRQILTIALGLLVPGALEALPQEQQQALLPRVFRLQSELAGGFFSQAQRELLASQDKLYQSLMSARAQAEREASAKAQQLQVVINHLPVILFALDREGRFTLAEGRGMNSLTSERRSVLGRRVSDLSYASSDVLEHIEYALSGASFTATVEVDGTVFETSYAPIRDTGGELMGVIGVSLDITERVRVEEELASLRFQALRQPLPAAIGAGRGGEMARRLSDLASMLSSLQETVQDVLGDIQTTELAPAEPLPLTGREREIIRLIAIGRTNSEVSALLGISAKTVEKHLTRVYEKLGVTSRAEAAVWAVRAGLI